MVRSHVPHQKMPWQHFYTRTHTSWYKRMGDDGIKKSSNPWVSLTTGCIAGAIGKNSTKNI